MLLSLYIWSSLFFLLGIYFFIKKKAILGVLFVLISIFGWAVALIVTYLYPDKL